MRKKITVLWLGILFSGIIILFWQYDWIYSLPTPVPENYRPVITGEKINLPNKVVAISGRTQFLHFFNPACPCSRFNIPHFKSLVKKYGSQVDFSIVVMSNRNYSVQDIREKFELDIPVYFDSAIAASCGVYSTPQAVIIKSDCSLYYRGNYNKSRYCTDVKTNYAQMALEGLLNNNTGISFNELALKAYGCQLPTCNK